MKNIYLFFLFTMLFSCTKVTKNNQPSGKVHTLKYIAVSPVKTMVTYYNKTGAKVAEYFTGDWEYEEQIEIKYNERFDAYLNIDNRNNSKVTGKILIDGKVVQEGSSTAWTGVTCNYTVE